MDSQRVRRNSYRRNKKVPAFLLLVLVLGVVSYCGASIWQHAEDKAALAKNIESSAPAAETGTETGGQTSAAGSSEASAEDQQALQQQASSLTDSNLSPYENLSDVVVPKTAWVDSSYFDDAVFVGDSITYGIKVYNTMTNATVIAHTGINPQTILTKAVIEQGGQNVTVLQALDSYKPGKIYIMLGSNGVAFLSEDVMMDYYGQFLDLVKDNHPDAIIYVQSILPVTAAKSQDEHYSNDRIDQYNLDLMNLCKEKGVHYLNVAEAFKDEKGNLPTEASPKDGMHFGSTYYMKWFDYLKCHAL